MNYPGVDEEGIFVAQTADEITGFTIVSIAEEMGLKQGKILELQVKDAPSMCALIHKALNYCKNRDVDTVIVVPPPVGAADAILKGWIRFETGVMMTRMLSVSSMLHALFANKEIRSSYDNEKIVFHLGDEIFEVKIASDSVDVKHLDNEPKEADMQISLSPQTLLQIVFSHANIYVAYLTGKVKVIRNTLRTLKLLRMMKLATPVHVSLVDRL